MYSTVPASSRFAHRDFSRDERTRADVTVAPMTASVIDVATVRAAFMRLFIAVDGVTLRHEDEQKVLEATGLLSLLGRLRKDAMLVDAAGGKGSVGLLAAEIVGARRVIIIERNPAHAALARAAVTRLSVQAELAVHDGDVHDDTAWVFVEACRRFRTAPRHALHGKQTTRYVLAGGCCGKEGSVDEVPYE